MTLKWQSGIVETHTAGRQNDCDCDNLKTIKSKFILFLGKTKYQQNIRRTTHFANLSYEQESILLEQTLWLQYI